MAAAVAAISSRETIVTCRLLRIGVPFGCSAATRLHAGRVSPEWLSPTKPSNRASTRSTVADRSEAARSRTSPSHTTRPAIAVGLRIGMDRRARPPRARSTIR